MLLRPLTGIGQLTFDDGATFDVSIDVKFRTINGRIVGDGMLFHPDSLLLGLKRGSASLTVSRRKVAIFISSADANGMLKVKTSGLVQPLD